jgi:predicted O-methyltransferase YrrM
MTAPFDWKNAPRTMDDKAKLFPPKALAALRAEAVNREFIWSCDDLTGSMLRVLAGSKPGGRLLELGTGIGEGSAWLLDGMDARARLTTVEIDPARQSVARAHLGNDTRIEFFEGSSADYIAKAAKESFDLIFADTWIGKMEMMGEAIALLKAGGFYIVDDLQPVPGWGPDLPTVMPKVVAKLEECRDLRIVKLDWSTGLIVGVKCVAR